MTQMTQVQEVVLNGMGHGAVPHAGVRPAGAAIIDALDRRRWRAVLARDRSADGTFVFAVRSTGVYCRPSCPARRPLRERVAFFEAPRHAEQAGFRACRRCRPTEHPGGDAALVERACRYIETHLDEPLRLQALGIAVGARPHAVRRVFARILGITPRQYVDACRLNAVRARLRAREAVTSALYEAGYGSSSRLYERASGHLGMTPGAYRRGARGLRVRYAVAPSPLGRLLVGATERGVCAICLGDTDGPLVAALRAEMPGARLERDEAGLGPWVRTVLAYLRGRRPDVTLPLDIQATAFQRKVWDALRAIPAGATRSYGEIARTIGRPAAVRAVARACATNPVALAIPCHRVVRGDGALGGYRWGMERKRTLLTQERRRAARGRSAPEASAGAPRGSRAG